MESNPPKCKVCEAKALLLKMLQSLKDSPFKQSHFAHLKLTKMPLLEIFILMFLQELEKLVKKGLKSDYIVCEENRNFLKGKLLFHQNLKLNFAHRERFFTSSDEFSVNIAPNRIIKSTLELLNTQNLSTNTSAKLMQMRFIFLDIPPSQSIDKDLSKCQNLGYFRNYKMILQWCEIFLKRKSFAPYQKDSKAYALYGEQTIHERHRHRYEVNNEYRSVLTEHGLKLSGTSPDGRIVEMIEIPDHPFFLATQAHPELKSRPNRPHPLFKGFIAAALK